MFAEAPPRSPKNDTAQTLPLHLLHLPKAIRIRIYSWTGVIDGRDYNRFINLDNGGAPEQSHVFDDRERFVGTRNLLLACRTIHEDLNPLVYANNHFFIRYNDLTGLSALRCLRPESLSCLSLLTIHLNTASCGLGRPCDCYKVPAKHKFWGYDRTDMSLRIDHPYTQRVLDDWHYTWNNHIRPNLSIAQQLQLNFVCDVRDTKTGDLAARPFMNESEPVLAACSIRLSHRRDHELIKLAKEAVATATVCGSLRDEMSKETTSLHFRYMDLPAELRNHILEYTDLVTPFREVEWSSSSGMYHRYKITADFGNLYPHELHGSQDLHDPLNLAENNYPTCWETSFPQGCFCQVFHAAYSTMHACNCWAPPKSFFLVSHSVRQDALQVFYKQNRFIMSPGGDIPWKPVRSSPERLPVSTFLSKVIPQDGLRFLRYLEIVFPPLGKNWFTYCPPGSAEWRDWNATLKSIKHKLDLSRLTIRLYSVPLEPFGGMEILPYMTTRHSEARQRIYTETIMPLRQLQGLGRFFAHLANPIGWASGPGPGYQVWCIEAVEQEVERLVMGPEYDSSLAGKATQPESRWIEDNEMG